LILIQFYFTTRYAVKAICGLAPEYSFLKLLMVAAIPVAGYFMAMKEPVEIV
jgi:phenylalanine-4-hydroxylase